MNIKEQCEEVTKFIESCWDENNQNDGLTFDERLQQRKKELSNDCKEILENSIAFWDD